MTTRSLTLSFSLACWALLAGCGTMSLRDRPWPELHVDTKALAERYPHAPAVMVQRSIHYRFTSEANARWIREEYQAIAVLDDGGERYAVVHVPIGTGHLDFLRARTRLPDGTVQDVTPEEQHDVVGHGESAAPDQNDQKVKVFRLPRVHVGSIVEYSYGIEYRTVPLAQSEPIAGEIPVQSYHLEFASESGFDGRVYLYNRNVEFKHDSVGATNRFYVDLNDVRAYHAEKFAPPMTVTDPWWALAVSRTRSGRGIIDIDSWDKIGAGFGRALYVESDRLFDGVKLAPKLGDCAPNSRCAAQVALDLVNEVSDLSTFTNEISRRSMKEALAARNVTNFEKALLLYRALKAVGIKARYVFLSRAAIHEADPNFPSLQRGDHLLLYLDTLGDGSEPLYVDPSCESCEVGSLPSWSAGRQSQILMRAPTSDVWHSDPKGSLRWDMTADTREQTPGVSRQIIDAKIDADGKVSGHFEHELAGTLGVDQHIFTRTWIDDQWQKEGERALQAHAKTAQRESAVATQWDKKAGRWRMAVDYSVAGYATPDRNQLVVPLTFLHNGYDDDYSDEPRVHDVMLRDAEHFEDTLTLHVPSGYVVGELPKAMTMHTRSADGVFDVSVPKPDVIRVRRIFRMHTGHWGPDEYARLVELIRNLESARQATIILKKAG